MADAVLVWLEAVSESKVRQALLAQGSSHSSFRCTYARSHTRTFVGVRPIVASGSASFFLCVFHSHIVVVVLHVLIAFSLYLPAHAFFTV